MFLKGTVPPVLVLALLFRLESGRMTNPTAIERPEVVFAMRRSNWFFFALYSILFTACQGEYEEKSQSHPPPALADSESRVVRSVTTDREYQITVALPKNYRTSDGLFPVLYMVDANGQFGTVAEAARQLRFDEAVPEMIVVGIGYPVGRMWSAQPLRQTDLTPTADPEWVTQRGIEYPQFPAPKGSGGGEGFLRFVADELIPMIESEYRADPRDRALYGHSLGGLFGVYALLHSEGTFHKHIIASPSLWWDEKVTFDHEAAYSEDHNSLPARAFFSVGMLEAGEKFKMVSNLREFVSILEQRNYDGLEMQANFYLDETHNPVIPRSIVRGLMWIYQDWNQHDV